MGDPTPPTQPANDVYQEWVQISITFAPDLPEEERRGRWQALYDRTFVHGRWAISPNDAWMVASLGSSIAAQTGDFGAAERRYHELLAHPSIEAMHWPLRLNTESCLARYAFATGRIEEGVRLSQAILDCPWPRPHVALNEVRNMLHTLFTWEPRCDPVPPSVAELIRNVAGQFRGMKEAVRKTKGGVPELEGLLERTYGRAPLPGRFGLTSDDIADQNDLKRRARNHRRRLKRSAPGG